jgi:DNA-binding response OmpR family regulator
MKGTDVIKNVRKTNKKLVIMLLTGEESSEFQGEALIYNIQKVITKPEPFQNIINFLKESLAR